VNERQVAEDLLGAGPPPLLKSAVPPENSARSKLTSPPENSAPIALRAAARYSGTRPSTISTLARPRTDSARACPGVSPPSTDSATSGRAFSAATFGEVVAVEITNSVPVQKKPTGITRGVPSSAL
jgi:hypothetical protein